MPDIQLLKIKHWYKSIWFKVLLIVIILFFIFGAMYLYQIFNIYKQMKAGTYVSPESVTAQPPYDMSLLIDKMSPSYGLVNAKVVVVEFGDFNCHYTQQEYPIFRSLMEKYKDQVLFYWRNDPVIEQSSVDLAKAVVCANKQGKFWPLHDKFFQMVGKLDVNNLAPVAQSVGLNTKTFKSCLDSDLTTAQVGKDVDAAADGEVKGTPTFFINGYKVEGAVDLVTWEKIIDSFLTVTKR
ncbi:MAG: thioredoxin domain-containing protein [Parcubacteria group bacterium]